MSELQEIAGKINFFFYIMISLQGKKKRLQPLLLTQTHKHICAYIYTHKYTYDTCTHTQTDRHTHTHTHTHIHIYTYIYIHTYIHRKFGLTKPFILFLQEVWANEEALSPMCGEKVRPQELRHPLNWHACILLLKWHACILLLKWHACILLLGSATRTTTSSGRASPSCPKPSGVKKKKWKYESTKKKTESMKVKGLMPRAHMYVCMSTTKKNAHADMYKCTCWYVCRFATTKKKMVLLVGRDVAS